MGKRLSSPVSACRAPAYPWHWPAYRRVPAYAWHWLGYVGSRTSGVNISYANACPSYSILIEYTEFNPWLCRSSAKVARMANRAQVYMMGVIFKALFSLGGKWEAHPDNVKPPWPVVEPRFIRLQAHWAILHHPLCSGKEPIAQWDSSLSVLPMARVQFPAMAEYFKGFFPGWSHSANPSW